MEISLYTQPRVSKVLISPQKPRTFITVSCRATGATVSMQTDRVNFYDMLSLKSENAGLDEIKRAYRSMALQFHPDVCPPSAKEESTRRFVELRKAYETLSDPVSRERYDYELGLSGSVGVQGKGHINHVGNNRGCSRKAWEDQLSRLRQRSLLRMQRRKNTQQQ